MVASGKIRGIGRTSSHTNIFLVFVIVLLAGSVSYYKYYNEQNPTYPDQAYVKIPAIGGGCVLTEEPLWEWEARQVLFQDMGVPTERRCHVLTEVYNGNN